MTGLGKLAADNMTIVMLVYGLALFTLGVVVLLSALRPTSLRFAKYLPWLAGFGFIHAINQWLSMLTLIDQYKFLPKSWVFVIIETAVFASIALFLFKFGVGLLITINERFRSLNAVPLIFYSIWAASLGGSFVLTGFGVEQWLRNSEILTRYLLTFPGAAIAGWALFLQYRVFLRQGFGAASHSFLIAAVALWLKALTCGLVVPYISYFPASVFNYDSFMSFAGFPVQIFRTADAILIAFGIVRGMRVFNIEENKQEERRSMELLALENISREIGKNPKLSEALSWAIREIIRLFDAKAGAIIMVSEQTGKPNIEVEHGFVPSFAQNFERMSPADAEKCPVGKVIRGQRPFITSNLAECPLLVAAADEPEKVNAVTLLPLTAKTKTFGAIALLFEDVDALRPSNVEFLSAFANQVGLAVENSQLEEQRRIALVLQRSLLPKIPSVPQMEIGVHYQSATVGTEVGGDFYDFIDLDNGLMGIVLGDVAGAGIDAAATVAMAKYATAGFALDNNSPADSMKKLNNLAVKQLTAGRFITAVYGVFDIKTGLLVFSNAGHLPPLIIRGKTREAVFPGEESGIALGIVPDRDYPREEVSIDHGDLLILYTDGLIEARHSREFWGENRLVELAKDSIDMPAQVIADNLCSRAREFSGGALTDDIAVVVIKRL